MSENTGGPRKCSVVGTKSEHLLSCTMKVQNFICAVSGRRKITYRENIMNSLQHTKFPHKPESTKLISLVPKQLLYSIY